MSDAISAESISPELKFTLHQVLDRIGKIESKLLEVDPMLPLHCAEIQKALLENEELVHVLTDPQIRAYMAGMMKYKNIKLLEEAMSKKRGKGKITADDL